MSNWSRWVLLSLALTVLGVTGFWWESVAAEVGLGGHVGTLELGEEEHFDIRFCGISGGTR